MTTGFDDNDTWYPGDKGTLMLGVQKNSQTSLSTDGQYSPFQVNPSGSIYTCATGIAAEGDPVSGNPVLVAGRYDTNRTSLSDGDVGAFAVTEKGRIITNPITEVNALNSTSTPTSAFTGSSTDVSSYEYVTVNIFSDIPSAPGGVSLQFSTDNFNWTNKYTYTYESGYFVQSRPVHAKYFRLSYNSSSTPTTLRIQTLLSLNQRNNEIKVVYPYDYRDAFGGLRISSPRTLLDITHTNSIKDIFNMNTKLTETGSYTYNVNESTITLSVTDTNDEVIRQSKRYVIYQPGKSLLIKITGVLKLDSNTSNGVTYRIGYFDTLNGIFFEYSNDTLYIVKRSYVTGSVVDTRVAQSDWNIDKGDGSSTSSYNINIQKAQIFIFDLQWLGVGAIRVGVSIDSKIVYFHEFKHANNVNTTYMTTANLPITYQITSASGSGTMQEICSTVISEGGYEPTGIAHSIGNPSAKEVDNTEVPIISIRVKSGKHTNIIIKSLEMLLDTNDSMRYRIYYYPNANLGYLTNENFISASAYSDVEYDTSATAINTNVGTYPNIILKEGYCSDTISIKTDNLLFSSDNGGIVLTRNIEDTLSDIITVTGKRIIGTGDAIDIVASLSWTELF